VNELREVFTDEDVDDEDEDVEEEEEDKEEEAFDLKPCVVFDCLEGVESFTL